MAMRLFSPSQLTGKSFEHLIALPCSVAGHRLEAQSAKAFQSLQQVAKQAGFNLQPASSFRDFYRQQTIWNEKYQGIRKVHDDKGNPLDLSALSPWQKCQGILRWSALPGASRHHWGTEIDVFDPDLLPAEQPLLLEPWEYEQGGYFAELSEFLHQNLAKFDFALPFVNAPAHCKIGLEPWHISYLPVSRQAQAQFTPELLLSAWQQEEIAGKDCLIAHLDQIFADYLLTSES